MSEQYTATALLNSVPNFTRNPEVLSAKPAESEFFSIQSLADLSVFERVLYQPETKRKQKVFLADLAKPEATLAAKLTPAKGQLVSLLERPTRGEAVHIHVEVPAGSAARLYLFEEAKQEATSEGEGRPAVFFTADVGRDAHLEILYLHPVYGVSNKNYLKKDEFITVLYHATVEENGTFKWTGINFGDSLLEKGLVELKEKHANADIGGAAYIQAGSRQEYQNLVVCETLSGQAKMTNHGVVEDEGEGHFAGIADIIKGAAGTVVREDNRFITLGERARAFADPTLLIDEYDVQASHAATVGQVEEELLFYLQSRGMTKDQARRLVTVGFLTPLLDRVATRELAEALKTALTAQVNKEER